MKYCLNSNVGPALLNEADEIAITKEDFGSVYMIAGRYPNATMIVPEPVDEFDWEGLKALVEAFPNRIIVCVAHAYALKMCAELKIPFLTDYHTYLNSSDDIHLYMERVKQKVLMEHGKQI